MMAVGIKCMLMMLRSIEVIDSVGMRRVRIWRGYCLSLSLSWNDIFVICMVNEMIFWKL